MIPYLGEKSKFKKFILPYTPNFTCYVEPFGGMYGIGLSINNPLISVYNDINKDNYYLFRHLKNPHFTNLIENIESSEEKYLEFKDTINEGTQQEKSLKYLYLLCHCNAVGDIGSGYSDKMSWGNISDFKDKYQYVNYVLNEDYKYVINKFDYRNTFFYIDPPYYGFEHRYDNHDFTKESHEDLFFLLKNIKGKFMLSCYDFYLVPEYSKFCNIVKKKYSYHEELLIMNY